MKSESGYVSVGIALSVIPTNGVALDEHRMLFSIGGACVRAFIRCVCLRVLSIVASAIRCLRFAIPRFDFPVKVSARSDICFQWSEQAASQDGCLLPYISEYGLMSKVSECDNIVLFLDNP